MPNTCKICSHDDRAEIENAILNLTSNTPPNGCNSIEAVAKDFGLDIDELKMHALFHTPLVGDGDLEQDVLDNMPMDVAPVVDASGTMPRESLTRRMKLREADMLSAVSNEYLVTLKTMGRRINKLASVSSIDVEDEDKQLRLARLLTKPMTDLYIGLGGEIRQTIKTMAELDRMLNGPEDENSSGLKALASAIRNSGDE